MSEPQGKKIHAGDEFKGINARDWNSFLDAVKFLKNSTGAGTRGSKPQTFKRNSGLVKCQNGTGTDLEQFHVVGFNSSLFNPAVHPAEFRRLPVAMIGATPTCDHVGKFGIMIDPANSAAPGNVGECVVLGVTACRVLMCDTTHEFCDVKVNDPTRLVSVANPAGAQILAKEPGLGTVWAIVRLSNKPENAGCVSTCTTTSQTTTTTTPTTTTPTTQTTTTPTTGTGTTTTPTTGTGTTTTGTTGTGTTTPTTGTGTTTSTPTTGTVTTGTGTTTPTTGTGTTTGTTSPTTGTGTTTPTTGTGTTTPTTGTGTTSSVECPEFDCSGDCSVSVEVVTDVTCADDGIVVEKTTICLNSGAVSVPTTGGA